jgi:hypothetical protein
MTPRGRVAQSLGKVLAQPTQDTEPETTESPAPAVIESPTPAAEDGAPAPPPASTESAAIDTGDPWPAPTETGNARCRGDPSRRESRSRRPRSPDASASQRDRFGWRFSKRGSAALAEGWPVIGQILGGRPAPRSTERRTLDVATGHDRGV